MFTKKPARITAFIGTLGASAALIGMAATNTGAYFTDSEAGTMTGETGELTIDKASNYALSFNNLLPGEYQDKVVKYRTGGNAAEDIWLHFPDGRAYAMFSGRKNHPDFPAGGLGRYGHFAVANNAGSTLFSSYNLANDSDGSNDCSDVNGHGAGRQATSNADTPPYCGVPHYIKIDSNVPPNVTRQMTITFGVTGRQTQQDQAAPTVPFEVVATQHGIRPDAENF